MSDVRGSRKGQEPEWEWRWAAEGQGSREKRGSRGRAAGLLGRQLLPREEPRPGQGPAGGGAGRDCTAGLHPAPPYPLRCLLTRAPSVWVTDREPVEGGPVCGAAGNCPGAESAQTPPSGPRPPCPLLRPSVPMSVVRAQDGAAGSPWTQLCRTHTLYKQPPAPAQRQGELGGPGAHQSAPSSGAPCSDLLRGAESSASAGPFLISTS